MQNLRALRRSRSLTFLDLAALTGIPARRLAEIEYGIRHLTAAERETLALVLGLAPSGFTGAHRRLTAAYARAAPAEQRALRTLMAAALAATLATSAVNAGLADIRLPALPRPIAALLTRASAPAETAAPSGAAADASLAASAPAAGALRSLATEPVAEDAALARLGRAIIKLRAALPEEPISPSLLVAPTPPESVAPPPLPVIEAAPPFMLTEVGPMGCPVAPSAGRVIITQGYGVGTHAPAELWGAIDLAVEGNSWYQPIVATHDGYVTVTLDSYPAGNHVWVNEPGGVWRTGYSHLAIVTVVSGQFVRAGEQIGLMGSSGLSSGPHLDYQVWRGSVNVDPTGLVGCW